MHTIDVPIAESGGPFRPLQPAPGLLRRVLCNLLFHPDKRVEPVPIDEPLTGGEILPIAGGIEVIHTPGTARDRWRCCGTLDGCCSRAMCVRTLWALVIHLASRV